MYLVALPRAGRPANVPSEEMQLARERLSHVFPKATRVETHTILISNALAESVRVISGQRWSGGSLSLLVPRADDAVLGYSMIDNVRGKDQLITYMLTVTPALAIRNVEVLAYRESYGGEIMNSSWLQQFVDKMPGDALRPGKEIRVITGATISSRSLTRGIHRALTLLHVMKSTIESIISTPR